MIKKRRFVSIIVVFNLFLLIFISLSSTEETKKYPPYPEVWGYEFPWPGKRNRYAAIDVAKTPNGDFVVTYIKNWGEKINKYEGILFFSGKKKDFTKSDYNEFWRKNKELKEKKVLFNDGTVVEQISIATSAHCPDPFYDCYIAKKGKDGKFIDKKMLLYLYDEPLRSNINRYCERNTSYNKDYILKKVDNVYAKFVPLEDGTFLIYDAEGNFIIRFDENFNTKSTLMSRKVFLISRSDYEKIYDKQAKESKINDQAMNDVIAKYLINLKEEDKK